MIDLTQCSNIGYIAKTHGVKGQVVLRLANISSDSVKDLEWVFLLYEGLPVPFFVQNWTERPPDSFLLDIEDISTIDSAQNLVRKVVYVPNQTITKEKDPILAFKNYMGYSVIDQNNSVIGELVDIVDYQDNPIMTVVKDKKEVLIPIQNDFITSIDAKARTIHVNLPEGLVDL